jgi:ketosteroid isomerase-like protein
MADDIVLRFPGTSRWSRTYRGRADMEAFMRELAALGLRFTVHDVLVKGWPWKMTVAVVISDEARDAAGNVVYANRAVEIWTARWGRITEGELFEDTEKATAWGAALDARASA